MTHNEATISVVCRDVNCVHFILGTGLRIFTTQIYLWFMINGGLVHARTSPELGTLTLVVAMDA